MWSERVHDLHGHSAEQVPMSTSVGSFKSVTDQKGVERQHLNRTSHAPKDVLPLRTCATGAPRS